MNTDDTCVVFTTVRVTGNSNSISACVEVCCTFGVLQSVPVEPVIFCSID